MIYIPPISEFSVPVVYDSGVANRERIVFRPTEPTNLALYGIIIGIQGLDGGVNPVDNWFFWFHLREINPPSWILLFTGKGEPKSEPIQDNGRIIHVYYWNKENTIFSDPNVVPVLVKINSMHVAQKHPNLKAGESIKQISKT